MNRKTVQANAKARNGNMYSLLYGFYKYLIQKDEYCVLILGLDNAGKTVSGRCVSDDDDEL